MLALSLVLACPAQAQTVANWRPFVAEASLRFGVPVVWIEGVMQAESGGRTMLNGRPIVSRAGAMGLMQLMPGTWNELRAALRLGSDPFDPRDNIFAGTAYLRRMYDRFGYPGMFAAYNAGPGRYAAWLAGRRVLPGETMAYLAAVTSGDMVVAQPASKAPRPTLFFVLSGGAGPTLDTRSGADRRVPLSPTPVPRPGVSAVDIVPRSSLFAVVKQTGTGRP